MKLLFGLVRFVVTGFLAATLLTIARDRMVQRDPRQRRFLEGHAPDPRPDGMCRGWLDGSPIKVSWRGKQFNAAAATGINVLARQDGESTVTKYPFRTWTGPGLKDPDIEVLKIDYDLPTNPLWLRAILDEVVEVEPGLYLGKLHSRFFPGFPLSLGFFWLQSSRVESEEPAEPNAAETPADSGNVAA
jgi:hypothetical protein